MVRVLDVNSTSSKFTIFAPLTDDNHDTILKSSKRKQSGTANNNNLGKRL